MAGRATGRLSLAVLSAALILGAACDGDDDVTATSTAPVPAVDPGPVAVAELVTGDCLRGIVIGGSERVELASAQVVSCQESHELEIFATFELDPGVLGLDDDDEGYPGEQRIVDAAGAGCDERLSQLGNLDDAFGLISIWPTAVSWAEGDRAVACAAYPSDGTPFDGPGLLGR